ncbi:L-serine ammonia-lyase [Psychrobacter sp. FDAARGOS_221]|uniref:L-serine ammonia-lyase n=1 Tax=Psychrobacter sp. FDAARGOS_221 TaxID=1975705 RepID=UPI000BB579F1|nr:L-serine ammonia-lyase [Psychrobacter sp. FDAARGOS_221]PNK59602.1 L-serine ammonia-lyase [Psychrobacter sp. FDAARGOS_221]
MISLFDMFKIGIGPSSSHTMGPMVAAGMFLDEVTKQYALEEITRIQVGLFGSLASTGKGHATDTACILGLLGFKADKIDTTKVSEYLSPVLDNKILDLNHSYPIRFDYDTDIVWHPQNNLPHHPNGLSFTAFTQDGEKISRIYYSIGGGFVATEDEYAKTADNSASESSADSVGKKLESDTSADSVAITSDSRVPYPFRTGRQLLEQCEANNLSISEVMMANELAIRDEATINQHLDAVWNVMQECVRNGCNGEGILPGGLKVRRRAKKLHQELLEEQKDIRNDSDKLMAMDWVDLYALAVNEENANGGRVVTAPTNGAAGIIPAVMHYYRDFIPGYSQEGARKFLLAAAAIGTIIKENASISGAEVGCQGEVGSACAMAASGLAEILGLTPEQSTNAAEIGIEHNLGLTCDPIGGLVQVPCIERNAMAAVKAINAARLAARGDGEHHVSLDKAIATMKATGEDMMDKYKETAMGGLAVHAYNPQDGNVDGSRIEMVEVGVGYPQC